MDRREIVYQDLVRTIVRMGYPKEFGIVIAGNLRTEKTMGRMIGYLNQANPRSANEIADESEIVNDTEDADGFQTRDSDPDLDDDGEFFTVSSDVNEGFYFDSEEDSFDIASKFENDEDY